VSSERRAPRKKRRLENPDLAVFVIYHFTAETNRRRGTSGEMVLILPALVNHDRKQETGDRRQKKTDRCFNDLSPAAKPPLIDLIPVS
jgi:hypothetical protein